MDWGCRSDGIFSDEGKMLLHQDNQGGGNLLAAHTTDFASPQMAWRWRRSARRHISAVPGLVFAKAMPFIGSGASAGFGGGVPAAGRQVLLTAWRQKADFEDFLSQPLAERLASDARHSWWSLFEVVSTRGSHNGAKPLMGSTHPDPGLSFAALTLGRTQPRYLLRFLREGARLGPFVREAPGLVTAFSAGLPMTGNCTVSLWRSERDMHAFAHSDRDGHGATVRRDPPILAEQLNARLRVLEIGGSWGPDTLHRDRLEQLAGALG